MWWLFWKAIFTGILVKIKGVGVPFLLIIHVFNKEYCKKNVIVIVLIIEYLFTSMRTLFWPKFSIPTPRDWCIQTDRCSFRGLEHFFLHYSYPEIYQTCSSSSHFWDNGAPANKEIFSSVWIYRFYLWLWHPYFCKITINKNALSSREGNGPNPDNQFR